MARFDLSEFKTDSKKQTEGVWVDFGGNAEFKIASITNSSFQKAFTSKKAPYDKMRRELTEDQMLDIMVYCLAHYVVLDWTGVFEGEEELAYTTENAERVLAEFDWVRERVIEESRLISNFVAEVDEEVAKN